MGGPRKVWEWEGFTFYQDDTLPEGVVLAIEPLTREKVAMIYPAQDAAQLPPRIAQDQRDETGTS